MRLLLDEGLPIQLRQALTINAPHRFEHVDDLKWKGKKDPALFKQAAQRGFDGIVTIEVHQLAERKNWRALRDSGLHHVSLNRGTRSPGKQATARVIASLVLAMPHVLDDLAAAPDQRIVKVSLLAAGARHEMFTPRQKPQYPYWS